MFLQAPLSSLPLLSIIIANYNYERFLGACIESAIAVKWDNKEIIVVDDGSTDRSVEVARGYKDVDLVLTKANGGQWSAANLGFAASKGAFVIFLDSDDLLHPDIMAEAMKVYHPGVSKIQFQMEAIDEQGQPLNSTFPQYAPDLTPARIRSIFKNTLSYPNAPGSGNVYARAMLEQIFPLDGLVDNATDTYCVAAAPLYGDVESVRLPLIKYRIHEGNDSAMLNFSIGKIEQEVLRSTRRFGYANIRSARTGNILNPMAARHGLPFMAYRVARLRGSDNSKVKSFDTPWTIFTDVISATFQDQGLTRGAHLSLAVACMLILVSPLPLATRFITWRFSPTTRPNWLRKGLRSAHIT